MTLEEIKQAALAGKTVHWMNDSYTVFASNKHNFYIVHYHNTNCIGLTWADGVTMNGKPEEFYIAEGV